jgi:hypothetical protein
MAERVHFGPGEVRFRIGKDTPFDELVATMEKVLTLPEVGRFKGCAPCMSGLDKFVFEDPSWLQIQNVKAGPGG